MSPPRFYRLTDNNTDSIDNNSGQNAYSDKSSKRGDYINGKRATRQWDKLYLLLKLLGVNIKILPPNETLRSLTFTCDNAFIYQQKAISANFKNKPRQAEPNYTKPYLKNIGLKPITCDGLIEGGDIRLSTDHTTLWIGYGFRTETLAIKYITHFNWLPKNIYSLKLIDPFFFHLDTCFCPFGNKYAIYYPEAFDISSQDLLLQVYTDVKLIAVTREEALQFCCNALYIPNKKVNNNDIDGYLVANYFSSRVRNIIHNLGVHCITTNMSEFIKSGGSVHCCVLEVN